MFCEYYYLGKRNILKHGNWQQFKHELDLLYLEKDFVLAIGSKDSQEDFTWYRLIFRASVRIRYWLKFAIIPGFFVSVSVRYWFKSWVTIWYPYLFKSWLSVLVGFGWNSGKDPSQLVSSINGFILFNTPKTSSFMHFYMIYYIQKSYCNIPPESCQNG